MRFTTTCSLLPAHSDLFFVYGCNQPCSNHKVYCDILQLKFLFLHFLAGVEIRIVLTTGSFAIYNTSVAAFCIFYLTIVKVADVAISVVILGSITE